MEKCDLVELFWLLSQYKFKAAALKKKEVVLQYSNTKNFKVGFAAHQS